MVLLGGLSTQFTGELVECRVVPCGVAITSSHAGVFETGARCCLIHTDLCAKLKVTLVESEKLHWKISLRCCCQGNRVYCVHRAPSWSLAPTYRSVGKHRLEKCCPSPIFGRFEGSED